MFSRLAVVALSLVVAAAEGSMSTDSDAGRNLMHHARKMQNNNYNYNGQGQNQQQNYNFDDVDTSFLAGYSVKFQGCHHVQQWNEDAQDEDDVRIMTKRLVRFRLCPSGECSSDLGGCSMHYGDYIVDMETYMSSFYESMQQNYGGRELQDGYDMRNYMECTQFDMRRHLQNNGDAYGYYGDEDVQYYVGPYCADQGGEIRLGLFTDDTCTSFARSQYAIQGLPYTQNSMVSTNCVGCGSYNGDYQVSDFCTSIYQIAGKCESKMNVYYANEAACSYIEGIKIIREDGVIRTSATRKSKAAAIAIGCFLTVAVLLAGYVYYLRTSKSNQTHPDPTLFAKY